MREPRVEPGRTYRLLRPFEVRDEQTGTIKHYLLKGAVLNVKRTAPEQDRVWVEGVSLPLPYLALLRHITEAS